MDAINYHPPHLLWTQSLLPRSLAPLLSPLRPPLSEQNPKPTHLKGRRPVERPSLDVPFLIAPSTPVRDERLLSAIEARKIPKVLLSNQKAIQTDIAVASSVCSVVVAAGLWVRTGTEIAAVAASEDWQSRDLVAVADQEWEVVKFLARGYF